MIKKKLSPPPRFAQWMLKYIFPDRGEYTSLGDFEEVYNQIASRDSVIKARLWFWAELIKSLPGFIKNKIYWSLTMFKNYFKIALRNIVKQKGYSFINITGLAIGMACCILIFLYVSFEYSYDNYHPDSHRIYHIKMKVHAKDTVDWYSAPAVIPALKKDFPEVEFAARVHSERNCLVKHNEKLFYEESYMYADQEIFEIFSIPFIQGDRSKALTRPKTVVITRRVAGKFFGAKIAYGNLLNINGTDYEITGIVKNSPANTHLKYDIIISLKTVERSWNMSHWTWTSFFSYIKLAPGVNVDEFDKKIRRIAYSYAKELLEGRGIKEHACYLHQVTDMHLDRYHNSILYLYILSVVGVLIMLVACLNFMNLITARSASRAKEIGVRKVIGAFRIQLVKQFHCESLLMSSFAFFAALALVMHVLPFFNDVAGTQFTFAGLFQPGVLFPLIGMTIFVGILSGIYPAFFLSAFKPAVVLKGLSKVGSRGPALRKILVVGQFTVSIMLIAFTILIFQQLNFMKDKHLGFDKEQKLVIPIEDGNKFQSYKNEFLQHSSITGATASLSVPGRIGDVYTTYEVGKKNEMQTMKYHFSDFDFIPVYNIKMTAGRPFNRKLSTDVNGPFIINEAAVKALGWSSPEEAIGKRIMAGFYGFKNDRNEIIGVSKDFFYRGLQEEIKPLVIHMRPSLFQCVTLNLNTGNMDETLSFVKAKWKELFPGDVFRYFFLNADFDRQYRSEERLMKIFGAFSSMAIFISCLGLFGLSTFMAERRTKEIGVRKVLGASISNITLLLSKEFIRWVLLANIIAWPIAYISMSKWLQNFAYRTDVGMWIFILSGLLALIIALITVSYQSIKAAAANPVEALKYE